MRATGRRRSVFRVWRLPRKGTSDAHEKNRKVRFADRSRLRGSATNCYRSSWRRRLRLWSHERRSRPSNLPSSTSRRTLSLLNHRPIRIASFCRRCSWNSALKLKSCSLRTAKLSLCRSLWDKAPLLRDCKRKFRYKMTALSCSLLVTCNTWAIRRKLNS